MATNDTLEQIMAAAKAAVQANGYNALSFRELAKTVGIKSASIHYYFPTKGDLGAAVARRYTEDAVGYFERLADAGGEVEATFRAYADVFRAALRNDNRMCLYGIMAAEYADLPDAVRTEVDGFRAANVSWLSRILAPRHPELSESALKDRAQAIFAAIEGAQLVARGQGDIAIFDRLLDAYRAAGLTP